METLTDEERRGFRQVFSAFPRVGKAVLFGSRARSNHQKYSDADIALFGSKLTLDDKWAIEDAIEALEMPFPVDLVIEERIQSGAIRDHIKKDGITIYERRQNAA